MDESGDKITDEQLTGLMDQMRQRGKKEREIYELIVGFVKCLVYIIRIPNFFDFQGFSAKLPFSLN